jgi:hypothetical protein
MHWNSDNRIGRAVFTIGLVPALFLFLGCGPRKPAENVVTIVFEDVVDQDDMMVKRILVSAPGKRTVTVRQYGDHGSSNRATIQPSDAAKSDRATASVILVGVLPRLNEEGTNTFSWLDCIRGQDLEVGGPAHIPVPADQKLSDLVQIDVQPGDYLIGEDIRLATVQGEPLFLTVE